ncbi:C4-type zinc ribbon domain-containing protein [uncultured Bacteroides sp.]|uniref:zinc ribbon domain-containing protein n=1 Tax=uncultured Bacteroides sp. TaxID=162156 RepID=UPI0026396380|nr:C4-type zinc ribbon domain-containing protein [uncultured Bacteroides sp.]
MVKEVKKDVPEISVEQKLSALYKLQTILSEMDKIKTLRGELPLEVRDLEDEITGLHTRIEKIKNEIEELKQNVATRKIDIESAKASIEKYKAQQDNVRNNREYDVLTKEIEFQSLEVELNEKRIKEANASIKAKEEEIVKSENLLEERTKDLEDKKNELDEIVAETKQEEERLRENAKSIESTIEPRLLQAFKRIRSNSRNGLGITYVQRGACGGCFNKIPAQRQLDIRMRKKIIVCEYCGRIMVDQELAGVAPAETEAPKETKTRRSRLSSSAE